MKTFKNLKTGVLEHVTNKSLFEQYEKYTDIYKEVEETKKEKKPTTSKSKTKENE